MARWQQEVAAENSGRPIVRALLPILGEWCRRRVWLTYHVTQVLSGHGCFGKYLGRIGREPTTQCHHCGEAQDTARHTLEECPAWSAPRRVLRGIIGMDLSLVAVVDHMVADDRSCQALASFCEEVMTQKEAAERERKADLLSARNQRQREWA
ncbi:uncharacterized protein LOC128882750 [Hylaeus volcanicus]|uniref:uncharacterized protein LOC128882750 n=1 Tax=Hylaeus volcanicus TaxID=313075 RepID=UPI0023B846C0|nr:uncharacterized protein LOC128882750 [Hylaeus volcanicus]